MPVAALGQLAGGRFAFRGMILTPDGSSAWTAHREGAPAEALKLAEDAAAELLDKAGPDFLRALQTQRW